MKEKPVTIIRVSLTCPECNQAERYDFHLSDVILGEYLPGMTNLGAKILECVNCQSDFVAHISYGLKTGVLIRRIRPASLATLDSGEYKLDIHGIAQEKVKNEDEDHK